MKKLIQIAVMLMTVAGLGGPSIHAQTKVTLTYMADQNWISDAEQTLAKKFEDKTGIHIDYQIVPSDQYFTVLQAKLNSGEAPDIFGGQSGKTDLAVQLNVAKNAVDLSGMAFTKTEDPLVLDQSTVGGKVYGLTVFDIVGTTWVVNYNKAIFTKLNLSLPKTYADFKALSQKIKDAGITPIYEPISDGWHHVLWFPEIGPRYEQVTPGLADQLNSNKATFAGNAAMTTDLTQLKEMYDLGFFGPDSLSDAWANRTKAMADGKIAMILATSSYPVELAKDHPEVKPDDYGVFVIP